MGVSSSTVVEAYDRLTVEGGSPGTSWIRFLCSKRIGEALTLNLMEEATLPSRNVDSFRVSRLSLDASSLTLNPGCGWLPSSWMPVLRTLVRENNEILSGYGTGQGYLPMRRFLARWLAEEEIFVDPDQIVLTSSAGQSLDLVCRLLLSQGDTVIANDPCYFNFGAFPRSNQVKVLGVPCTPAGPELSVFERLLIEKKPRLYVTNSGIQNPTGVSLSPHNAYCLLNLAATYGLTIVEDGIFRDFEADPSTFLASLDGLERVVRIGS